MQLICRFGVDLSNPIAGIVVGWKEDGLPVDMSAHPGCFLIPVDIAFHEFDAKLGRYGKRVETVSPHDDRPWTVPAITPAILTSYAANLRYTHEVAGILADNVPVATDRASQSAVEKLASRAARDSKYAPSFKGSDGKTYVLTNDQIVFIGNAVDDHVQACRAMEDMVAGEIASGKITKLSDVDTAFKGL